MQPARSPLSITLLIASALFMEMLDGTIIATALPQMAHKFGVGVVSLNIGMTAYMVTLAVFIPISGWVADRFGSRTVFSAAIAVFTISSVLCGRSQTLNEFTLMRILQGIGGAMMVPVGRLVVLRTAPKDRLVQAIAYITWPALAALVIGPPLGGFITTYFGWHWIFFLNVPLGVIALILALLWIPNDLTEEHRPFDWLTFIPAGLASTCVVYALEKLGTNKTPWQIPATILTIGLVSAALALLAARRPSGSLIDLESMRFKSYSLSIFGGSCFRIAVSVLPFLLPLMFQVSFGMSPFASGLYLLALFAGDLSMKAGVIQMLRRFGFRRIMIVNGLITAASIALCATIGPHTPPAAICAILFFHGACRSIQFTAMTTLAYTEIPPERMSTANGFLSAVMQLSLGMGVATGAITLRVIAHANGHSTLAPHLADFHIAILINAFLALLPVLDSLGLAPDAGAATSGHRQPEPFSSLA
jgi:EmrB/QacA subfamily drug resistance transporter